MALTITNGGGGGNGGAATLYSSSSRHPYTHLPIRRNVLFPLSPRTLHVVSAKKFSSRSGRFDSKNRRSSTTTRDEYQDPKEGKRTGEIERGRIESGPDVENVAGPVVDDGYFLPELPGDKPDFWEGTQWDGLGFFVEYLWAFGIVFAVIYLFIIVIIIFLHWFMFIVLFYFLIA